MSTEEKKPLEKVCIICAKGSLEDVYASLVMANGAVMEGIETNVFFTFFGLEGITKERMNSLHTATTGNKWLSERPQQKRDQNARPLSGMKAIFIKKVTNHITRTGVPEAGCYKFC